MVSLHRGTHRVLLDLGYYMCIDWALLGTTDSLLWYYRGCKRFFWGNTGEPLGYTFALLRYYWGTTVILLGYYWVTTGVLQ